MQLDNVRHIDLVLLNGIADGITDPSCSPFQALGSFWPLALLTIDFANFGIQSEAALWYSNQLNAACRFL